MEKRFKSLKSISKILRVSLWVFVPVTALEIIFIFVYGAEDAASVLIGGTSALVYIYSGIVFLVWFHRAYANLPILCGRPNEKPNSWAVWGFIVPILSFFRPYQLAVETLEKTGAGPALDSERNKLNRWWRLWIIYCVTTVVSRRISSEPLDIACDILGICAAIACIMVVSLLTERETQGGESLIAVQSEST